MEPTVSVLLPVYNQEKYVSETIESILGQTFTDFELIILDDGSTDNSSTIIKKYASEDSRVKAHFKKNSGKCDSTNWLAQNAKGRFLALIDADDVMLPNRLEKQTSFHLENPEIHASSCHCHYIDAKGVRLGTQYFEGLKDQKESRKALEENKIVHCAFTGLMIVREAYNQIGGLRSPFWPVEDLDFANRIIECGFNLVIMQEPLMKYRLHITSVTTKDPLSSLEKADWCMHCTDLRRKGKAEISYEDYFRSKMALPWVKRINKKRSQYSNIFFRQAGIQLMSKNYFGFLYQIMLASVLSPSYVFRKVRNMAK